MMQHLPETITIAALIGTVIVWGRRLVGIW